MTEVQNPFRPTRYEHSGVRQVLWLSPLAVSLQGGRSFFIYGPRGSGKTSLLRSLNWRERTENETLRPQLSPEQRKIEFLAIYMRMPDYVSGRFSRFDWKRLYPIGDQEEISEDVFQIFVELVGLRLVFEGLFGLAARGALKISKACERKIIDAVRGAVPEMLESYGGHRVPDIERCAVMLKYFHEYIRKFMTRGGRVEDFEFVPFEKAGTILSTVCGVIVETLREDNDSLTHIKICIDDCEMLTHIQQRYLNTLIRRAESPVFWIISYVSPVYETTATTIPSQTLSDADRKVEDLEDASEETFLELCERVSGLRLQYYERKTPIGTVDIRARDWQEFRLRNVLGDTSVNGILQRMRARGGHSLWQRIEEDARRLAQVPGFSQAIEASERAIFDEVESSGGPPPYYEAYLLRRLNLLDEVLSGATVDEIRGQKAPLRRKQRAALLAISAQTRSNVPYSGWQVVMGLSDGCIRDYLEIMASIFDEHLEGRPIRRANLRSISVTPEKQRVGIVRSSQAKVVSIVDNAESYTAEVYKLIACLGELTRLLQVKVDGVEPLRTAERGIYNLSNTHAGSSDVEHARDNVANVIRECLTNGFLRVVGRSKGGAENVNERPSPQRFRLHRRFAPNFGFSYRGPYAGVPLSVGDLAEICTAPDKVDEGVWAVQMERKISRARTERTGRADARDGSLNNQGILPLDEAEQ